MGQLIALPQRLVLLDLGDVEVVADAVAVKRAAAIDPAEVLGRVVAHVDGARRDAALRGAVCIAALRHRQAQCRAGRVAQQVLP